jgi:hypothetical protein
MMMKRTSTMAELGGRSVDMSNRVAGLMNKAGRVDWRGSKRKGMRVGGRRQVGGVGRTS